MTIGSFLKEASEKLKLAGIESARLDTLILLEDELHKDRTLLLAHTEEEIPTPILANLYKKIVTREKHMPLAYIRGKMMFYGREFIVSEDVLVPRPETESMIDLLKSLVPLQAPRIADVGAGSGCIGITAKLELPQAAVDLYDIDERALAVAKRNAKQLHADVTLHTSDLVPEGADYDIILANLPYIPEQMEINKAASYEPRAAIFSGIDGFDHYKVLWGQLYGRRSTRLVITESLPSQHHVNALLARKNGYYLAQSNGLAQAFCPMN